MFILVDGPTTNEVLENDSGESGEQEFWLAVLR